MQNEENTIESASVESEIKRWTALRKRLDELKEETSISGTDPDGGKARELEIVRTQLFDLTLRLQGLLRGKGVIDGISDQNTRRMVEMLVEMNAKEALDTLQDDDDEARDPNELHGGAAWNFVYNLGTPAEQYLNYIRTSPVVAATAIPARIHELLEEARICFAVGQGNAVMALGRMILEFAITDIGIRIGRFPEPDSLEDFYKAYPPYERADTILGTGGPRRAKFRRLYDTGSKTIHSSPESSGSVPLQFLEEVIAFVNEQYAINLRQ
mgnify:CR=1 FL=1